jgi:Uma2 family endonuclease
MDNGIQLGGLIDPLQSSVEICWTGQSIQLLESPTLLSGEDLLPGFKLKLSKVWGWHLGLAFGAGICECISNRIET